MRFSTITYTWLWSGQSFIKPINLVWKNNSTWCVTTTSMNSQHLEKFYNTPQLIRIKGNVADRIRTIRRVCYATAPPPTGWRGGGALVWQLLSGRGSRQRGRSLSPFPRENRFPRGRGAAHVNAVSRRPLAWIAVLFAQTPLWNSGRGHRTYAPGALPRHTKPSRNARANPVPFWNF